MFLIYSILSCKRRSMLLRYPVWLEWYWYWCLGLECFGFEPNGCEHNQDRNKEIAHFEQYGSLETVSGKTWSERAWCRCVVQAPHTTLLFDENSWFDCVSNAVLRAVLVFFWEFNDEALHKLKQSAWSRVVYRDWRECIQIDAADKFDERCSECCWSWAAEK